jgi:hypothetical protein
MNNPASECSCVVDTDGLLRIAKASANLKGILIELLTSGQIGVPSCAWKEFQELYEDEAATLKQFVTQRIIMKRAYYIGAARIVDKIGTGFPRGSYDDNVELVTASIAITNGYRVLTSAAQVEVYKKMDCDSVDLESWVEDLDAVPTRTRIN